MNTNLTIPAAALTAAIAEGLTLQQPEEWAVFARPDGALLTRPSFEQRRGWLKLLDLRATAERIDCDAETMAAWVVEEIVTGSAGTVPGVLETDNGLVRVTP